MHADRTDEAGRQLVTRNDRLPEREILTGAGAIPVTQGRVRDNDPDLEKRVTFSPSVLPSYLRKIKAIEELIPWLYEFPAEHWSHLRTTNPIESTFATIRLRHRKTKGSGTRRASLAKMFKLAQSASKKWRRLNCHEKITHVIEGRSFKDGKLQNEIAAQFSISEHKN